MTRTGETRVPRTGPSPAATALVEARNVSITHPDATRPAVRDVSFRVGPGEVVLLLGASGAGKSTLTLALNGLIPHSADAELQGTVLVGGIDSREATPGELSARVGMVFQDPDAQVVTGSVFDEVAFGLENLLTAPEDIERRTESALRRMGLWDRRDDDPDELSGGGRQRLAIACALAMSPPLVVLDEPTANLDPAGVADVSRALRDLVASGEHAILLVEHDLEAALSLATRIIVLGADGGVAFDGAPERVLADHAEELIALGVLRRDDAGAGRPVSAGTDNAITVRDLTVRRGRGRRGRIVIDGLDADIVRGSITAIVGENGAGKTTFAQALAGVVRPARGTIDVLGLDPARTKPRVLADRVGFVFQNPEHQFVSHTVREELAHDLRRRGLARVEVDRRTDEMLDRLGLTAHQERHPFLLSGGQKRRLSVGTVLIGMEPGGVLILDEPLYGQDRARADELIGMLRDVHATGTTIIIVTHDLGLVERIATHVIEVARTGVAAREVAPAPKLAPLDRLNPLAKLGAVLPAMIALALTRDPWTPGLMLAMTYVALLAGARRDRRLALWLTAILPAAVAVLTAGFSLWGTGETGLATGLRLAAMLALALVPGLSGEGTDLVRAFVRQVGLPYRIGYAALAALRFVPRFRHELEIIRAAHRVRGHRGSPTSVAIPLLASAIRHAERVALAMDARAFGAYPTRTERHPVLWRARDTWFLVIGIIATAIPFVVGALR